MTDAGGRLTTAEAWGGPPEEQLGRPGEPFGAGPTDPGNYVILGVEPHHVTQKWKFSRIPWGARLRVSTQDYNDVMCEETPGHWKSLNTFFGIRNATALVARLHERLYGNRAIPATWIFNDFGPRAVRYFVDSNHNGKLDKGEEVKGEMFHTTPDNEAEAAAFRAAHPGSTADPPVRMFESHGCIHMRPSEFSRLIASGVFQRGTKLRIHRYTEHFHHP